MSGEHGTDAGYGRHRRLGEQPCGNCLWAHNVYNKQQVELRQQQRAAKRQGIKPIIAHGSLQGLKWHMRTHKPVCQMCLTFACKLEHDQALRDLRRAA